MASSTTTLVVAAVGAAVAAAPFVWYWWCRLPPPDHARGGTTDLVARYRAPLQRPAIIAHRGCSNIAPENSLAAIRKAKEYGAVGVEVDLRFTADGVAVLAHDGNMLRMTGVDAKISATSFAELRKLDISAKHRFADQFVGERIPTLEEALQLCLELGLELWIDVKTWPTETADTIVPLIQRYQAHHRVLVCSFNPAVLWYIRRRDPNIVTVQTRKRYLLSYLNGELSPVYRLLRLPRWLFSAVFPTLDRFFDWCLHRWLWRLNGITFMLVHHAGVSADYVDMWRRRGVGVVAWTVNATAEKAYYHECLLCPYMTDDARPDADAPPQQFHMPAAF